MERDDSPMSAPEGRGYARSLRRLPRSWLEGVESAAAWCAAGGAVATIEVMIAYVHRYGSWMASEGWWRLTVQALIFVVVMGAGCGAGIAGAVLALGREHTRWWHVVGGLGAVPAAAVAGAFGADYFGNKPLPYLGLGGILTAIALGVVVAGTGLARTAHRALPWPRALLHAIWPSGALVLLFGAVAGVMPADVNAELDVMRGFAGSLGLAVLGTLGGALIGALGGLALATSMVAARRRG